MSGERYIGVMTGNSMDAADAVLADFDGGRCRVLAAAREDIGDDLAAALRRLAESENINTTELLRARIALTEVCARAVRRLGADAADIAAAGCHGQTLAHRPALRATWQLLDGALLAELTGMAVVCDFRARDIAAGGEGAPLAPLFHQYQFADKAPCDIVNIGGIANITHIRAGGVSGYDIGPGMMAMDAWHQQCRGGRFDEDGAFAAAGKVNEDLLTRWLAHAFFSRPPPKSCGREEFALARLLPDGSAAALPAADIQATLLELTARAIADNISAPAIYLCGGGGKNAALMKRLRALVRGEVALSDAAGVPAAHMEAALCAWLAKCHINRETPAATSVTGGAPRIPGALYPR